MASGLPILATRHGGIPEAVDDSLTGLLVAERDHAALAKGMLALANNSPRFRSMSAAAAASVRARFNLAYQSRLLGDFYFEAISARG
jgi:glycosyltransferase involved in cell wall biosynthesis